MMFSNSEIGMVKVEMEYHEKYGYRVIIDRTVFRRFSDHLIPSQRIEPNCFLAFMLGINYLDQIEFFKKMKQQYNAEFKKGAPEDPKNDKMEELWFPSEKNALDAYENVILPYVMAYKLTK